MARQNSNGEGFKSPLSHEIWAALRVTGRNDKPPLELPKYYGDAKEHVFMFNHHMFLYNLSDASKAWLFSTFTLYGRAWSWFIALPPDSVYSYDDLVVQCLKRFDYMIMEKRVPEYLYSIVQRPKETLREFMSWFSAAMLEVDGLTVRNLRDILCSCLRHKEFVYSLVSIADPKSFTELMDTAQGFMWAEDFELNVNRNV